jgi:hypothetical protein
MPLCFGQKKRICRAFRIFIHYKIPTFSNFKAHKPITETAFITQFAKLRRVEFRNYGERTIEFHKDEEKSAVANQQDGLVCVTITAII